MDCEVAIDSISKIERRFVSKKYGRRILLIEL